MQKAAALAVAFALVLFAGCGGKMTAVAPPPAEIAGQWQLVAKSFLQADVYMIFEANLSQTNDAISASTENVLFLNGVQDTTDPLFADVNGLGGPCDQQTLGDVAFDGTLSAGPTLTFTLNDTGPLGMVAITGSAILNSGGTSVVSGDYSIPAGCGFNLDNGGITTGALIPPFSGTFTGTLNGGSDQIVATFTQDQNLNLTITGTDNLIAFTLTGTVIGGAFQVSGNLNDTSVQLLGVFDPTNNDFLIYDNAAHFLGELTAGTNPAAAVKKPHGLQVKH
jgi:hypothetical protein